MTVELVIRPLVGPDHQALTNVILPVFRAGDTYTVDPDISPEAAFSFWTTPEKRVFVAEADGAVLGTYFIRPNNAGGGAHVCNCGYITAASARGRGVARAMLDHSLSHARGLGYRAMQFNFVVATNTRAVDIWSGAGFDTVGRLPMAFRHPTLGYVDALVMYRSLV
jgi:GNAT superfamily N-acetyltransferase